ncbi:MAG: hypothetical protein IJT16_08040 [Lachnospiraceae bacterium]|nr:hypothetical protein [Lachnospiraceae bacterium]
MGGYVGNNNIARKITGGYVGVNGVARKITKGYVGVNGIARKIFDSSSGDIYGIEWDGGASPLFTRTDAAENFAEPVACLLTTVGSSPFDDILPWSGMEIVEDPDAGTLVKVPKYYYKWTRSGSAMKLQISPNKQNGFYTSPAHADRGDGKGERDYVYIARYFCTESTYKSISGATEARAMTIGASREKIHSLGSDIWQVDFAMYWTIAMLYLVEFATWNSQETIGFGNYCRSSASTVGSTDDLKYHSGIRATSRGSTASIQYRNIENIFGMGYCWYDGIFFRGTDIYGILNPDDFSDTSKGIKIGARPAYNSSGFIKSFTNPTVTGFEFALFPYELGGTYSTYICDRYGYQYPDNESNSINLGIGGGMTQYEEERCRGIFAFYIESGTGQYIYNKARLMKLP